MKQPAPAPRVRQVRCWRPRAAETPPAEQEPPKPSAAEKRAAAVEEIVVERTLELTQGVAPDFAPTSADCEYVRSTPGGSDVFRCSVTDGDISLGPLN
jgi:hypothetical protein